MNDKRAFLGAMVAGVVLAGGATACQQERSAFRRSFSLDGATGWLNSNELTPSSLLGKVVLIDFWTYSCINWRREFPYVKAWAAKYRTHGLVVIGVHTPEFEFEKDSENVRRAVTEIGVDYPVAIDSDHAIWRSFGNAYWPALYFIDAQGRTRHHHFGEGHYDESERVIQRLLVEARATGVPSDLVVPMASGAEAPADWESLKSPETYMGFGRARNLVSSGAVLNTARVYETPARLGVNEWALAGEWKLQSEAAVATKPNARIAFAFHARDLHLVMGPSSRAESVPFRITIDGKSPGEARGVDVDEDGRGAITGHRMYQLVRQSKQVTHRRFEIEFLGSGVEVFSFTFG